MPYDTQKKVHCNLTVLRDMKLFIVRTRQQNRAASVMLCWKWGQNSPWGVFNEKNQTKPLPSIDQKVDVSDAD